MSVQGGILLCDKPTGMGSALLTNIVKRRTRLRVGHTGTLDRFASGLMLLVLGPATALADHFLHQDKEYEATFAFGSATDTHDPEGTITDSRSPEEVVRFVRENEHRIRSTIQGWRELTEQTPPVYSALKQQGRRLSDRARDGEVVVPKTRTIRVDVVEILEPPDAGSEVRVRLGVSSGTYIRSFARDLGLALDFPVHLAALRRTRVGEFHLDDPRVWHVPIVAPRGDGPRPPRSAGAESRPAAGEESPLPPLVSLREALPQWPVVAVESTIAARIAHGQRPELTGIPEEGDFFVQASDGRLLAWGRSAQGQYSWRRVFDNSL